MPQTVFFSWQSDRPKETGRYLIENALKRAIKAIGKDTSLDLAFRDLRLDRDTKGVPGTPPIMAVIFKKINQAAVFVPDLTFVASRNQEERIPNANVLIEYGFALKRLGWKKLVPVMNTFYGAPTKANLPFDLGHLRFPIEFACPEDADEATCNREQEGLAKKLEEAIRLILKATKPSSPKRVTPERPPFLARQTGQTPGRFTGGGLDLGVTLEEHGLVDPVRVGLSPEAAIWLRVMPLHEAEKKWNYSELRKAWQKKMIVPIFSHPDQGLGVLRAEDKITIYSNSADIYTRKQVETILTIFSSGEIWSTDTRQVVLSRSDRLIPLSIRQFTDSLKAYADFLLDMGLEPPYRWFAGMEGLDGRRVPVPSLDGPFSPRGYCITDQIQKEGRFSPRDDALQTLTPFFQAFYEACNVEFPRDFGRSI
jgi:hypothetical protein